MTEPQPPAAPGDPWAVPSDEPPVYPGYQPPAPESEYGRFEPLPEPDLTAPKRRHALAIGLSVAGAVLVVAAGAAAVVANSRVPDAHTAIKTTTEPTAGLGTLVHSHGITVDLPQGWTNVPTSPAELKAMAAKLQSSNPQMANTISQLSTNQLVDHLALIAIKARTDQTSPVEVLDVVVGSGSGITADAVSMETKMALAAQGATDVVATDTTVGGLPAVKVTYATALKSATGTRVVPASLYAVINGNTLAELVFQNPGDGADANAIADSLAFH